MRTQGGRKEKEKGRKKKREILQQTRHVFFLLILFVGPQSRKRIKRKRVGGGKKKKGKGVRKEIGLLPSNLHPSRNRCYVGGVRGEEKKKARNPHGHPFLGRACRWEMSRPRKRIQREGKGKKKKKKKKKKRQTRRRPPSPISLTGGGWICCCFCCLCCFFLYVLCFVLGEVWCVGYVLKGEVVFVVFVFVGLFVGKTG